MSFSDKLTKFSELHKEIIEKLITLPIGEDFPIYFDLIKIFRESLTWFLEQNFWNLNTDINIGQIIQTFQKFDQRLFNLYIGLVLSYAGYWDDINF